jgi:hypothetical protein
MSNAFNFGRLLTLKILKCSFRPPGGPEDLLTAHTGQATDGQADTQQFPEHGPLGEKSQGGHVARTSESKNI